ncbi:DUF2207 domain-containing protein [Spiractinospora alimapuensis]|uniref:DUF2207 domain-containing protein n=1 Tax=Spiractinospora alimapuensis TaxID=2820884 RepID=UPI001F366980|nr:DUF2207 domain-containing protein [Spiractinospora alimapuensis]QVQ53698.1 DUF2207 domain-containing protein [Spiractinospora alimapuensis]
MSTSPFRLGPPHWGRPLAVIATAAAATLLTGCGAGWEHEDRITSFSVEADLAESGTLTMTEAITYDFGVEPSAGLAREIPTTAGDGWLLRRTLDVDVVDVESPSGAPAEIEERSESHGHLNLGIGDSANEVTGEHTYVLTYTVDGAVTTEDAHEELYWDFVGTQWGIPINDPDVVLTAPAIDDVVCVSGEEGESARSCHSVTVDADSVTMTEPRLPAGQGITARVNLPAGSVDVTEPSYRMRPLPLWVTPSGIASLLAALVFVPLWLRAASAVGTRLDRLGRSVDPTAVSPAAAGLLTTNEKIRPEHLMGMLVDLEERGALVSRPHPDDANDWVFEPVPAHGVPLSRAEELFVAAMFRDGACDLASIQETLTAARIRQIREALVRELQHAGFAHRSLVRYLAAGLALVMLFAVVIPLPIIGEFADGALTGLHMAALFIVNFTLFISLISFVPIGATRKGRKAKLSLSAATNDPDLPASYLLSAGDAERLSGIGGALRFASDPDFHRRWNSTLQVPIRSANPSASSGGSGGGTSVGGGGGGGGGGRR